MFSQVSDVAHAPLVLFVIPWKHCIIHTYLSLPQNPHSAVRLYIEDMDISRSDEEDRCYHWLEIRYNLIGQTGPR